MINPYIISDKFIANDIEPDRSVLVKLSFPTKDIGTQPIVIPVCHLRGVVAQLSSATISGEETIVVIRVWNQTKYKVKNAKVHYIITYGE